MITPTKVLFPNKVTSTGTEFGIGTLTYLLGYTVEPIIAVNGTRTTATHCVGYCPFVDGNKPSDSLKQRGFSGDAGYRKG